MILACALIAIIDGDTISATCYGAEVRIRLADTTVAGQENCPDKWTAALRGMMPPEFGLQAHGPDANGAILGTIHAPEMVNAEMVKLKLKGC